MSSPRVNTLSSDWMLNAVLTALSTPKQKPECLATIISKLDTSILFVNLLFHQPIDAVDDLVRHLKQFLPRVRLSGAVFGFGGKPVGFSKNKLHLLKDPEITFY